MQHLADILGISRTTVSLVLKGDGDKYKISKATQKRILDKVKELNFKPNYFAQSLNKKSSMVIGALFPNMFEGFMNEVLAGMEEVLYPEEYTLMMCTSRFDVDIEKRNLDQLLHRNVDGFIIIHTCPFRGEEHDTSHLVELAENSVPFIFIDRYLPGIPSHKVLQDDKFGSREGVKALYDQGCRSIGYISFDLDISTLHDRLEGYDRMMRELRLSIHPEYQILLKQKNADANDLEEILKKLQSDSHLPDGFLITTHGIAQKTMVLLQQMGLQIGQDIKIARFGNDPSYLMSDMVLIKQPHFEMGKQAARLLLSEIQRETVSNKFKKIVLKPEIV